MRSHFLANNFLGFVFKILMFYFQKLLVLKRVYYFFKLCLVLTYLNTQNAHLSFVSSPYGVTH